jgi:hypothetical protein
MAVASGIVAYAYDMARRDGETDPARLYTVVRGRFAKKRGLPHGLIDDPEFDTWLRLRAAGLGDERGR